MPFKTLPSDLRSQVNAVVKAYSPSEKVFLHLVDYYETELVARSAPDNKKRKFDNSGSVADVSALPESLEGLQIILQLPDLSVQSPFRKKVNMVIGAYTDKEPLLAFTKSIKTRPEFILDDLSDGNVEFATILQVPDKKPLRMLLIAYKKNLGHLYKDGTLLVQFNNDILTEQFGPVLQNMNLTEFLLRQFAVFKLLIVDGTTEDVFFVHTYIGNKEGHLYFLPDHMIFGFKKPILVFKTSDIISVTYTSITRNTFNVSLDVRTGEEGEEAGEKIEFSLVEQGEFEKIDQYVKSKKFEDRSMAEELKAQRQLKSKNDKAGALSEAAKLVPGGEKIMGDVDDDDDEEFDANYESDGDGLDGDDEDDEDDKDDKDDKGGNNGHNDDDDDDDDDDIDDNDNDIADYTDINLEQELKDLQDDLDDDDYLKMADYGMPN
ncbi:hypothetical protein FOA43_001022 [Brettanomyces nanus]|uniref:Histone chaperone RTT106 n=1 Tax=Eeniella nana TaxID=13502 RepID=A0A875S1I8_EENNA|nr:uncharacterized protein FOA43_001022 [Brettanomyces nanus]QPG73709.1 hypothetical protein FOA43_001022 [Brettanomyces nanus]